MHRRFESIVQHNNIQSSHEVLHNSENHEVDDICCCVIIEAQMLILIILIDLTFNGLSK